MSVFFVHEGIIVVFMFCLFARLLTLTRVGNVLNFAILAYVISMPFLCAVIDNDFPLFVLWGAFLFVVSSLALAVTTFDTTLSYSNKGHHINDVEKNVQSINQSIPAAIIRWPFFVFLSTKCKYIFFTLCPLSFVFSASYYVMLCGNLVWVCFVYLCLFLIDMVYLIWVCRKQQTAVERA